ncbi:glycosyltransferase family 2 protein [Thalassobius sp. S69A]|uniref:glycosyltransferase family 2 protein n=1 Tax=unclassified Thalassovita TaxID=2619711 RepID=UPI000C114642|nr:hypothetical protein [Paracoccaceae bacterium]MBT25140.1 hypothetical protein [Paracoccaceae bacterium]
MSEQKKQTYKKGFPAIVTHMQQRQDALVYHEGESLPPLDIELDPLKTRTMLRHAPELGSSRSSYASKYRDLAKEFDARPALLHLHGLLIANMRRQDQPPQTAALFERLWAQESEFLLENLDTRWLVSAVTTFGDHGQTALRRQLGHSLSVLFGMMKLYETERLYSGRHPDQTFDLKTRSNEKLAMQMDPFSLTSGGLDVNMLGALWQLSEQDPLIRPLAQRLLQLLVQDDRTVFRRLLKMRERRAKALKEKGIRKKSAPKAKIAAEIPPHLIKTDPQQIRWGLVSLVKAPLPQIAAFVAYHLDLGADRIYLYLDAPDPATVQYLSGHPKLQVTACDADFWQAQKKPRMKAHQVRQSWVATQAYQDADVDWLAHIDVDEFLLPPRPVPDILADVPDDAAMLRIMPAELLAGTAGAEQFKLQPSYAGQPKAVRESLYPTFGAHLPGGFISHREGKNFVRTGLMGIRVGIHACLQNGRQISNRVRLAGGYLGHAHAPSWEFFRDHMQFRMQRGSYRKSDEKKFRLLDILTFLQDEEGEDGLRLFFTEVCEATPRLTEALESHDMLLRYPLDLPAKLARHLPPLPAASADKDSA